MLSSRLQDIAAAAAHRRSRTITEGPLDPMRGILFGSFVSLAVFWLPLALALCR